MISTDIPKAVELLSNDDIVAIPTETVYGLAGNIFSQPAIHKIFELKQRPLFNPLIVHTSSIPEAEKLVVEFPEKARQLAEAFWPGSLTLVLPKKAEISDLITAGKDTVAIRIPNHPATLALLKELPFPLAAPSANPFGSISPTQATHVDGYFGKKLSMVLDGGSCKAGIESTIVGFENGTPVLYRLGSISVEDIEAIIGPIEIKNKKENAPNAPGMLSRHYAPNTHTYLVKGVEQFAKQNSGKRIGTIVLQNSISSALAANQEVLSVSGDLQEATANLYAAMHRLDQLQLDLIIAEKMPDTGLGRSLNDRLERATKS